MIPEEQPASQASGFPFLLTGQIVSVLGSGMTSFALSILTYGKRGSISELSLVILAFALPGVLAAPFAGALLDRFDRRIVLALSAFGAALSTFAIALFLSAGNIALWQILLCVGGISLFGAAQLPAITALTAALVSKENYARVNGLWQVAGGLMLMVSPLAAGLLMQRYGIRTIVSADFCTYLVAIATLAFVRLPRTAGEPDQKTPDPKLNLASIRAGWSYVWQRPGLRDLLVYMTFIHIALDMIQILLVPLVLGRGTARDLATVMTVSSLGMMIGGTAVAISGGPKRRIVGVLAAAFVLGFGLFVAGQESRMLFLILGMFCATAAVPLCLSSSEAIWQVKVESAVQGRVFALEAMMAQAAQPVACVLAPLACNLVARQLTLPSLMPAFGEITAKQSAGLVLSGTGVFVLLLTLAAAFSRRLRNVESDLPDTTPASFERMDLAPNA